MSPATGQQPFYTSYRSRLFGSSPGDAYTGSGWVYACVSANASTIAQVPWHVEVRNGDKWDRVEDASHPLAELLEQPNNIWAWEDIVEHTSLALDLVGNSVTTIVRRQTGDKAPLQLWWMCPESWTPKGAGGSLIDHYMYRDESGRERRVEAEDVVHVMLPTWGDPRWGVAPLTAARRQVSIDETETEAIERLGQQGFAPSVHIHFPDASEEEVIKWTEVVKEDYSGSLAEGRPFVTGGPKADVKAIGMTLKDARFVERKRLTRTEIAAIFATPEPVVGILEHANYSNMKGAIELWWDRTLLPRLSRIQRFYMTQLVRPYYGRDVRLVFDQDAIPALAARLAEKLESALDFWAMGWTRDEINKRLDLQMPEVGGEDTEVIDLEERRRRRDARRNTRRAA